MLHLTALGDQLGHLTVRPHSVYHLPLCVDVVFPYRTTFLLASCRKWATYTEADVLVLRQHCTRSQMIDKMWFDWQHRDPANAYSFSGGSVQTLESLDTYNQYPNGGPPFLSVSAGHFHFEMENSNFICSRS
jgi:hypothetical protein